MMSIVRGDKRLLMRYRSLEDMRGVFVIPGDNVERLETGFSQALVQAGKIQKQLRAAMAMQNLAPGGQVIRTDTGEILAEVERLLNGSSH